MQVMKIKSYQEIGGESIRQVGGVSNFQIDNTTRTIKWPTAKPQAPSQKYKQEEDVEKKEKDVEKQENYAKGTFLGLKNEL